MPAYFDESSLAFEDIHAAVKHLEELGYVRAVWKGKKENHILQKVILCEDKAGEVYRYIGRMPKREQQKLQLQALFLETTQLLIKVSISPKPLSTG